MISTLETLHVAALPYPTSQGTQAAIGMMLDALVREGRTAALLTYDAGVGDETHFTHLKSRGVIRPSSMRSGPSLAKLAADVELRSSLGEHAARARVVVAHHVEAAMLARSLRLPAWVFVAHTDLGPELPTYFPPRLAAVAQRAGWALDHGLARAAPAVAAISPQVARGLEIVTRREVVVLPVPVERIEPRFSRWEARAALRLPRDAKVVLYAGNLDAYQGLDRLTAAMRAAPEAILLIATESDVRELAARLAQVGVRHAFAPLSTEDDRARAHAVADVAVVPRLSPGGLPIKLLDALARSVPVVAMERALAGLSLFAACRVTNDDAGSFGQGIADTLDMPSRNREEQIARGHAYLASSHTRAHFVRALDRAIANLRSP